MGTRKAISDQVQANVIEKSASRCVVCYGTRVNTDSVYPNYQIAHIDQNSANNNEDNLALLCLDHHNLYDSTFSQAKNYKPENIKRWRDSLYNDVANNRLPAPMIQRVGNTFIMPEVGGTPDESITTLRKFLKVAGPIEDALQSDGTLLTFYIRDIQIDYIETHFSSWMNSDLRCRKRVIVALQDEFVNILWEIHDSYEFIGTLNDAPAHIIPAGYFHRNGNSISVGERDRCGDLFSRMDIRDQWILDKLKQLRTLFIEMDDMAMD